MRRIVPACTNLHVIVVSECLATRVALDEKLLCVRIVAWLAYGLTAHLGLEIFMLVCVGPASGTSQSFANSADFHLVGHQHPFVNREITATLERGDLTNSYLGLHGLLVDCRFVLFLVE
jgi:hypothetical protein